MIPTLFGYRFGKDKKVPEPKEVPKPENLWKNRPSRTVSEEIDFAKREIERMCHTINIQSAAVPVTAHRRKTDGMDK